jgi:hypothetical protein
MEVKKISDTEKFKGMWLNDEITTKEIADHFKIGRAYVHQKRTDLGLPPKGTKGFAWGERMRELHKAQQEETDKNLLQFLKEKGGFCPFRDIKLKFHSNVIQRLALQEYVFVIAFNLGRGTGVSRMRNRYSLIFKEPYIFKSYVCNSRTAIIKLMFQALKKPETRELLVTLTSFLRGYLTDAERFAVLWKLGIRKWSRSQVRSSIQIDGVIKPIERHIPSTP